MSAATDIDISTITIDALDFEPGCEHQHHEHDKRRHEGPAVWIQLGTCPHCGDELTCLVCDRWRQAVSQWAQAGNHKVTCPACWKSSNPADTLTFTKI